MDQDRALVCISLVRTTDRTTLTATKHASVDQQDKVAIHSSSTELLKRRSKGSDWKESVACSLGPDGLVYGIGDSKGLAILAGVRGHCHARLIWEILQNLNEKSKRLQIDPEKPKAIVIAQLLKSMQDHMNIYNEQLAQNVLVEMDAEEEDEAMHLPTSSTSTESTRSSQSNCSQRIGRKRIRSWFGM
jgi:hypothetical protein